MAIDPRKQLPGGVLTFNEEFFDALVRHQIGLMRLSGSIRNDVFKLLNATERDMADKIRSRLTGKQGLRTPSDVRRMNRLIKSLTATRLKTWKDVNALWVREMVELAKAEPGFVAAAAVNSYPVVINYVIPEVSALEAIVRSKPFQGKTMKGWAQSISAADVKRIEDQIKIGFVQGETGPQIARRIVGSARLRGVNGVTEITRRQASAITRTAVNGIANFAKREFYMANRDVFKEEIYVATLDNRTTPICQSLDGKRFPVGEGEIPPVHIQCRSLRVAVVTPELIGSRPVRNFTKQGLVREFSKSKGLGRISDRAKLPRGTKGEFDQFSRRRMRELTGRTPAKTTYQEFLTRQTTDFQDDILGKIKGKLFRDGGLTLDKFVDKAGNTLTLNQLKATEAAAFVKAGIKL